MSNSDPMCFYSVAPSGFHSQQICLTSLLPLPKEAKQHASAASPAAADISRMTGETFRGPDGTAEFAPHLINGGWESVGWDRMVATSCAEGSICASPRRQLPSAECARRRKCVHKTQVKRVKTVKTNTNIQHASLQRTAVTGKLSSVCLLIWKEM